MEVKKTTKVDIEGKKGIFFEIGLTLALAMVLFAFEWKASTEEVYLFQMPAEEMIEEEIIPITQQMLKPPPPPPPMSHVFEVVEDVTDIDEEFEIIDAADESDNKEPQIIDDFGLLVKIIQMRKTYL